MTDKEDPSKYTYTNSSFNLSIIEKVNDATPGQDAAGGLDEDDVWGDVEDVSSFFILTKLILKFY